EKKYSTQLGGLILQSPYYDIRSLSEDISAQIGSGSCNSCSSILPNPLDNASNLKLTLTPLLLIHGAEDQLIPIEHSKKLYAVAVTKNKQLINCKWSDHNNWNEQNDIIRPVQLFVPSK